VDNRGVRAVDMVERGGGSMADVRAEVGKGSDSGGWTDL